MYVTYLSKTNLPVLRQFWYSSGLTAEKAQQEPHWAWFLMAGMQVEVVKLTCDGPGYVTFIVTAYSL